MKTTPPGVMQRLGELVNTMEEAFRKLGAKMDDKVADISEGEDDELDRTLTRDQSPEERNSRKRKYSGESSIRNRSIRRSPSPVRSVVGTSLKKTYLNNLQRTSMKYHRKSTKGLGAVEDPISLYEQQSEEKVRPAIHAGLAGR